MCAKEVHKLFKPIELINELETRLREIKSDILPEIQPLRHFIEIKQDGGEPSNFFISMSAYVSSLKCFGSKLLTLYPGILIRNFYFQIFYSRWCSVTLRWRIYN